MSAQYTFLPWMRRGLANQIKDPAGAGAQPRPARGRGHGRLRGVRRRRASPIVKPIQLVGPGRHHRDQSAAGRSAPSRAPASPTSSRTISPPSISTTRISPGAIRRFRPTRRTHRLPPWIVLIVLKDDEFER